MDDLTFLQNADPNALAITVLIVFGLMSYLAINWILDAIGSFKMFRKAGEAGWKAFIPFLNDYVRFSLYSSVKLFIFYIIALGVSYLAYNIEGGLGTFITTCADIAVIVLIIKMNIGIARSHGKGTGMVVLLSLCPGLGAMILGFGKSQYTKLN